MLTLRLLLLASVDPKLLADATQRSQRFHNDRALWWTKILGTWIDCLGVRPAPEPSGLGRSPLLSSRLEIHEARSGGRAQGSRAVSIVVDLHDDRAGEGDTSVALK